MQPEDPCQNKVKSAPWLILLAAVLWGTAGTAQALAPAGAQPVVIGTLRLAISGAALLIIAGSFGGLGKPRHWPLATTACAAICMAVLQVCFFGALNRTGVATGTTIFIGSSPVFAGLIAFLIRGERLSLKWWCATVLAIFGCSLLIGGAGDVNVDMLGIILALSAGCAYALYAVVMKGLLKGKSAVAVLAVTSSLGALLLSPCLFTANLSWLAEPRGIMVALYLGLGTAAIPYWLFASGLRVIPVATAVTLNLAEPLTAALLGVLILGERLSQSACLGMIMLVAGLLLVSFSPRVILARVLSRRSDEW
jgi:DME family drug/metabolite transporter